MAHAAKAALSCNPDVIGHGRSECVEFHDLLIDTHRPLTCAGIDMPTLWKRACRKAVRASPAMGRLFPLWRGAAHSPSTSWSIPGLISNGSSLG
jgi:hypothetical protein